MTTRSSDEEPQGPSPRAAMLRLIRGLSVSRALWVAAKLGIADLIEDGPRAGAELAGATGTHAWALTRVLRALCSVGVFSQDDAGRFALTPLGATLRSSAPDSARAWATAMLGGEHYQAWSGLMHSVRTGETAFDHLFGQDVWSYRAQHPEHARIFDESMANLAGPFAMSLLTAYDFAACRRVVDVGGGDGTLVEALLRATPALSAVVLDLPHVAAKATQRLHTARLGVRCEVIGASMLDSVPAGADTYILSRILHDWGPERAATILRNCRRAMPAGSALLIIERLLPDQVDRSLASEAVTCSDLTMMVMNGGRERTEAEFRGLLEAAGLRHARTIVTAGEYSIIEARPA
jgi:hypothetical protein